MLNYQTTSFHDALYARQVLGLRPAPEFDQWLNKMQISGTDNLTQLNKKLPDSFAQPLKMIKEL